AVSVIRVTRGDVLHAAPRERSRRGGIEAALLKARAVTDLETLLIAVAVIFERAIGGVVNAIGMLVIALAAIIARSMFDLIAPASLIAVRIASAIAALKCGRLLRGSGRRIVVGQREVAERGGGGDHESECECEGRKCKSLCSVHNSPLTSGVNLQGERRYYFRHSTGNIAPAFSGLSFSPTSSAARASTGSL